MNLKETPLAWRRAYALHRRRTGTDSLGNETSYYDMTAPDQEISAEEGLAFQSTRTWNSGGSVGKRGVSVEETGESAGGVLEAALFGDSEISPFDRIVIDGAVWEVREIRRWPNHREIVLQRAVL